MKRVLSALLALAMLLTALPMGAAFAAAEDGLLLHYEMKDNTAVTDSAGDYDGTLRGSTEWVGGLNAYAVQLAGGEDYI